MQDPYTSNDFAGFQLTDSGKKIALFSGLALFPGISGIFMFTAYRLNPGFIEVPTFFQNLLLFLSYTSAFLGLAILLVAGFIILVTGRNAPNIENFETDEISGDASPTDQRRQISQDSGESMDTSLKIIWIPALIYLGGLFMLELLTILTPLKENKEFLEGTLSLLELVGIPALGIMLYFWLAGLVRLNRKGMPIQKHYYLWPTLGTAAYIAPFIFF